VNLLLGRYHRPVAEERIFMFLDLNDSTAIAAALGPFRFNDFKNDFFHDMADPILKTRGQIYQYVGDEAVVTWTSSEGSTRATVCVASFSWPSASTSRRSATSRATASCPSSRPASTADPS
jgi:adenylate cyclase